MPTTIPLARLLSAATRMAIEELQAELARVGFADLRPAHGYALNAIGAGTTTARLAAELGMTKQGAAKLVDWLLRADYVERFPHADDGRARLLELTERGKALLRAAESIQARIESRWVGAEETELRRVLERLVAERYGDGDPPLRPLW